jgi:hypothetical protein
MRRTVCLGLITSAVLAASAIPASAHTISPTSHHFGSVKVGATSAVQIFAVKVEVTPLHVTGISSSSPDFRVVTDPNLRACGEMIPGDTCYFGVILRPLSGGAKTATITVSGIGGTLTATVTGTAVSTAKKKKCKKKKGRTAAAAKKCKRR